METDSSPAVRPAIPVRTPQLQDEWTETYLGRAARALGIRRPWRNDLEVLRQAMPLTHGRTDEGRPVYGAEVLPRWAARGFAARIRVCPYCFRDERYVRARWRIQQLTVCTKHGVTLQAGLVEPALSWSYKDPSLRTVSDVTAEELMTGATCPTPVGLEYARLIWQPVEQAICSGESHRTVAELLAWALLAERLMDAAVTAHRGLDYPPDDVPRHEHRGWWLRKEKTRISPDFEGVSAFLVHQGASSRRQTLIATLSWLIGDESRRRTVMSRLPLVELKELLLAVAPPGKRVGSGALPRAQHPPDCQSFEAVEVRLGFPPSMLDRLVRDGYFQGVKRIQFGRKRYTFVPNTEVDRVAGLFASYLNFGEVLEALAIDRGAYRALHDAGFVPAIKLGQWRRYRRLDVSALLGRLESVSQPESRSCVGLQPLMGDWLRAGTRAQSCIRPILADVLEGRIPLFKRSGLAGLQAYWVDPIVAVHLRRLSEAHRAAVRSAGWAATQRLLWEPA